jgi:hypothetical protein
MPHVMILGGPEEGLTSRWLDPRELALLPPLARVLGCSVEGAAKRVAAARRNVLGEWLHRRNEQREAERRSA